MNHISYRTSQDYWKKAEAYISLEAQEMNETGIKKNIRTWIIYTMIKPSLTFLSLFFRHKGFMDGWYGFVFAYWSALHFPIAYRKYIRIQQ